MSLAEHEPGLNTARPLYLLALAPLVLLAHVLEEAPRFVDWFNRHVEPDLTMGGFYAINALGLLLTALIALPAVRSRNYWLGLGLIAWLSFLMLANGALHIAATFLFREYSPGAVTSAILYLPYFVVAIPAICRNFEIRTPAAMPASCTFQPADVQNPEQAAEACADVETVVCAVGVPYDSSAYRRLWPPIMRHLLGGCARSGAAEMIGVAPRITVLPRALAPIIGLLKRAVFTRKLLSVSILASGALFAGEQSDPYLYVLGVAQDAGYPQAGCYEQHCMPGWKDKSLARGAVSLGLVDPASRKKYLFEATPSFPEQMYELEQEAPSDKFQFGGIFLTHAHIGHYAGLMFLGHEVMGAAGVPVFVLPRMAEYLRTNGPWSQLGAYQNISLKILEPEKAQMLGAVKVTPFLVPHRDEYSEAAGYRIEGPNKTAVFIPDIDKWSKWDRSLPDLVKSVDYALIDATFYAEGELPGRDMSLIPHPLVVESMALLQSLPDEERSRVWFIHMNHTNPMLDENSEESRQVREEGFNIAHEGIRLPL